MTDQDTVYLKVTISRDVSRRFKSYIANKYPDLFRGPLSEEVEKALTLYLDMKENKEIKDLPSTHTHTLEIKHPQIQHQQHQQSTNQNNNNNNNNSNSKYDQLIEAIKRYSNSNKQISSGLAKKAISQTVGMDKRTINKYLKILQDNDVLYTSSEMGMFDVQTWIFGDYEINNSSSKGQSQQQKEQSIINVL